MDPLLSSSMRQALCKCVELMSSRTFLAIKCCEGTNIGKVVKQSRSSIYKLGATRGILVVVVVIIMLPLRLNTSGQGINRIMLTNDTSFWPCSVSLYLSLPRKLIGLLDPSSPVRLMASTWSLPDRW